MIASLFMIVLAGLLFGIFNLLLFTASMEDRWIWKLEKDDIKKWKKAEIIMIAVSVILSSYGSLAFGFGSYSYIGFFLLSNLLFLMARTDWKERIIPDKALISYFPFLIVYHLIIMDSMFTLNRILGAACAGAILGIACLIRRDSVGLGDIKLVMVCGLLNGFPGVLSFLFRSMVFSAVYCIAFLFLKRMKWKSEIPFAPFLFLGAII